MSRENANAVPVTEPAIIVRVDGGENVTGTADEAARNYRALAEATVYAGGAHQTMIVNTTAKGKAATARSTTFLREMMNQRGVNPIDVLLYFTAGFRPKFKADRARDEDGNWVTVFRPSTTPDGSLIVEECDAGMQLVAAKEVSKYLYPQLKATDLKLPDGEDKQVNSLAALLLSMGPGDRMTVTRPDGQVLEGDYPDDEE
jgi:hypothetical protein